MCRYVVVTAGESFADAVVRTARVVKKWPSTVLEPRALSLPAQVPQDQQHTAVRELRKRRLCNHKQSFRVCLDIITSNLADKD